MTANELEIGKIIDGRYQLVELLGAGGSGTTYRAIRLSDRSDVAIKILSLRHINDWKQLELFEREAKVLSQLNHPQIPKYLEYFHLDTADNRTFWIVQQLAPGKSLTEWVNAGWRGTEAEVKDITSQLLGILQYLHQQSPPLIHRDIKPHNIIRDEDGRVFLVDFGAVQNVYHDTLLKRHTVAGTYGYMAPEQFRGAAVIASDLYGLGATILYVLTHRSPADLPQARLKLVFRDRVNISDRFADWLEKILEPEPVDRFASADIALNALQKQHQFRKQQGIKIGFPWKSAAAVAAILMISIPLIYQYRYGFLTTLGLPPRDLCTVIEKQDIKSLHEYLTHGVSINANVAISNDGRTGSLLHCALVYNQDVIVKDLLENGASLDSIDSNNKTPLIAAISARQLDLVKLLIAKGAEVNDRDSNGQTPLMATIFGGELDLVKLLIAKGAKVDNRDKDGQTPLIAAISGDKLDIVELLIAKSAKVNEQNKDGQTPLIAAISGGKLDIIELLIAKSAEVNGRNQDGQTPLIAAINNKNSVGKAAGVNEPNNGQIPPIALDLVKLLISKGAKVNDRNKDGQTPLIAAVFNSDPSIVKTLLSKGAEIDKKHSNNYPNQTPLTIAISRQEFDMVELLIAKGAGINERNKDGQTPLMVAIATGDNNRASEYSPQEFIKPEFKLTLDKNQAIPKTIELLLNRGADPNLRDINGDTALHFIGKLGNVYPAPVSLSGTCSQQRSVALYTLDLLMRHKVDRQATNKYGDTALHVLARKDFFPVTERMIRYGWDPSQKDRSGRNAFQLMNAAQPRESRCIKGSN